jgi:hypothetical protein
MLDSREIVLKTQGQETLRVRVDLKTALNRSEVSHFLLHFLLLNGALICTYTRSLFKSEEAWAGCFYLLSYYRFTF